MRRYTLQGRIRFAKDLEHVRMRPRMYIGDVSSGGLHVLLATLVDNVADEALEGHCSRAAVVLGTDGSISVEDEGRGISVNMQPAHRLTDLEIIFTKIGACYCGCGGRAGHRRSLLGVGVAVVNALSDSLVVETTRAGRRYHMRYERGEAIGGLECIGAGRFPGTLIRFVPDRSIFERCAELNRMRVIEQLHATAALAPGLSIHFADRRYPASFSTAFQCPSGLTDFVRSLTEGSRLARPIAGEACERSRNEDAHVRIAVQADQSEAECLIGFANRCRTDVGAHIDGLIEGLDAGFNDAARQFGKPERGRPNGLRAVVAVDLPDPEFNGQLRERLVNPYVHPLVARAARRAVEAWIKESTSEACALLGVPSLRDSNSKLP